MIGDSILITRRIDGIEDETKKLREAIGELDDEKDVLKAEIDEKADDYDVDCKVSDIENRIDAIEEGQGDDIL